RVARTGRVPGALFRHWIGNRRDGLVVRAFVPSMKMARARNSLCGALPYRPYDAPWGAIWQSAFYFFTRGSLERWVRSGQAASGTFTPDTRAWEKGNQFWQEHPRPSAVQAVARAV